MPADVWSEAAAMLAAGGVVAAAAVPAGLVGWAAARRAGRPVLPAWRPWRVPWGGFEVAVAFLLLPLVPDVLATAARLPPLVAGVAALPVQIGLLVVACRALYPRWRLWDGGGLPGSVAVAVGAWAVLTPAVLLLHTAALQVLAALGRAADEHPLAKMAGDTVVEQLLFLARACVAAPLVEEVLFRGLLLTWVLGSRERYAGVPAPPLVPPAARPWLVTGVAVLYAATAGKPEPGVFAGLLAAGLAVLWVSVRRGRRHFAAVYATAALFAAVHSAVWPSPVPLFLLGLGLGWCAVRTRGVLVPAAVHGLFNAVSAVYVLRGGAG